MPIPRYERDRQNIASQRFTRGLLKLYIVAAVVGLIVGIMWVAAGILKFHPLW